MLGRVLVEFDRDEVRFVATDRYLLSLRTLRPRAAAGPPGRLLNDADTLVALGAWAARAAEVTLVARPGGAPLTVRHPGGTREVPVPGGTFPAYRDVLAGLPEPSHRVVVERVRLIAALDAPAGTPPPSPWNSAVTGSSSPCRTGPRHRSSRPRCGRSRSRCGSVSTL
ncbi:hypothetical protein [Streptomyces sp. LN699]|uniref:hypothetical protein n=1 Tax=Streptomyces sp. LN699 TaxID=3112981 RepID=UPI00371814D6